MHSLLQSLIRYQCINFIQALEETLSKEEKHRQELEAERAKLIEEKNELFIQLESSKGATSDSEDRVNKLNMQKQDLERQIEVGFIFYILLLP